ncbi:MULTISPECIES: glycine oxidase ThiO [unclassified Colwellia]|uniref:glycine oxidase ThiO n=1 Tax=unclassified Colwellia TaxID=196834 RepID=UPI0015F6F178|nr:MULTISPECIES: glycine oxidase ThiO [unclassified Colwellia]MBA6231140.1 glycine oxidase ThiO [Colwellia sp. MB02u-7]MBA6235091.1 glycine oxidase ThiO [Colwellia sp. MB02u-11]MBA6257525.1 glycine oxidase ThiO [Colwellia sp. MB3u-28]MBA6260597.1 glycine oxidase ThiO [Colwellia sp. MB3u-41]MBA6301700.1 glycine oxidase ThiO [Colwellia sp. MB3u-22]
MTLFDKKVPPLQTSTNIVVIGAGLVGRLIALSLVNKGHDVTLIDKDNKAGRQSAAYAAAGLLTPLGEAMHSEPNIVEMGFESLKLWPEILAELDAYTYFQQAGALMVSHEQDQGDYLRFVRYIKNNYPQHPLLQLNRQQIIELEPELGRSFNQGVFLPEEGQIGNRKLLIALQQQLDKSQLTWLENAPVVKVDQEASHCLVTYLDSGQGSGTKKVLACDLAIDCRGIGARSNESNAEAAPLRDLRGVRGELFQLFAPDVHLTRPIRLMHPRYQLYIAPKTKGFYVVGATEVESENCGPMTVRSSMELLSAAYSVHPGFAEASIRQQLSQLRPAFSDNQPKISVHQRLIQVNGLFRHGFLIAPVVLKQLIFAVDHVLAKNNIQQSPYNKWLPITEEQ